MDLENDNSGSVTTLSSEDDDIDVEAQEHWLASKRKPVSDNGDENNKSCTNATQNNFNNNSNNSNNNNTNNTNNHNASGFTSSSGPGNGTLNTKSWSNIRFIIRSLKLLHQSLIVYVPYGFVFDTVNNKLFFLGIPPGSREHSLISTELPQEKLAFNLQPWNLVLKNEMPNSTDHGKQAKSASEAGNNISNGNDGNVSLSLPSSSGSATATATATTASSSPTSTLSKEEQLLRERKRQSAIGITGFEFHQPTGKILFKSNGSLYVCSTREDPKSNRVKVIEIPSPLPYPRLDPKFSHQNGSLVSFVRQGDIWVVLTDSGIEKRLTFVREGDADNIQLNPKSAGVAEFVMQEEFSRFTGYWWQPSNSSDKLEKGYKTYRILYIEIDESMVDLLPLTDVSASTTIDNLRYPKAGHKNAKVELKIVEFYVNGSQFVGEPVTKVLKKPLYTLFPWMEYLVRCDWTPDGENVWIQILDRRQQKTVFATIPLATFIPNVKPTTATTITSTSTSTSTTTSAATTQQTSTSTQVYPEMDDTLFSSLGISILVEETNDVWINVHDCRHFFKKTHDFCNHILWASEESGFCHLYLLTQFHLSNGKTKILSRRITAGPWQVDSEYVWVDETRSLVYFIATKDSPIELHLYVIEISQLLTPETLLNVLDGYDLTLTASSLPSPRRLTTLGYSHSISMSPCCMYYTDTFSSTTTPPSTVVYKINCNTLTASPLAATPATTTATTTTTASTTATIYQPNIELLSEVHKSFLPQRYIAPELFSFQSRSGVTLHGLIYKPAEVENNPNNKLPVVLFVYGGPSIQMVTNEYKANSHLRLHLLAELGYVVIIVDGRGSARRGLAFEGCLKGRLGSVEISDQVEALEYLFKTVNYIDKDRVAIHGWSYGGYLSLMGLAQRPDVFKIAISGAPVCCWESYDTAYTERYLGLPTDNPLGYSKSSVLGYLDGFPDDEDRLLLIHGLIDENVHFQNSALLIDGLIRACKPYRLQIYPGERHGIRQFIASEHYETALVSFLKQNL